MNQYFILILILLFTISARSQPLDPHFVNYTPSGFGPNSNPVPDFTDATISEKSTFEFYADYYYGFGDNTKSILGKIEIPLLPKRISIKLWSVLMEHYKVSEEIAIKRQMTGNFSGFAFGDIYSQTRISLLSEKNYRPALILNATLKTASGTNFHQKRYFDTPGYYFDVEAGKSFFLNKQFIDEIRLVGNAGFMCWHTFGRVQNDAPMYGIKLIAGNSKWNIQNTLSGYYGWMHTLDWIDNDYADSPLVFSTKVSFNSKKMSNFIQFQYGIKDFPYNQIRVGTVFKIDKLTPKYKLSLMSDEKYLEKRTLDLSLCSR